MSPAKVFMTGCRQEMCLLQKSRFEGIKVEISIMEIKSWYYKKLFAADQLFKLLMQMLDNFYVEERGDEWSQDRDDFYDEQ